MLLMVRPKAGGAEALAPAVRAAISRIDKEQLVSVRDIVTLEDIAWAATGRHRFRAVMVTAFAALALVLAMVGVFGILAYSVQQRVRDFGVRRALGATTGDVMRLVVVERAPRRRRRRRDRAGPGGGARPADRRTMLFGVAPLDSVTFAAVTWCWRRSPRRCRSPGPAWRATRIDPAVGAADAVASALSVSPTPPSTVSSTAYSLNFLKPAPRFDSHTPKCVECVRGAGNGRDSAGGSASPETALDDSRVDRHARPCDRGRCGNVVDHHGRVAEAASGARP